VIDYAQAGVDRSGHGALVARLQALAAPTSTAEVVEALGYFAGAVALPAGLADPVLVSGTDNVGTKVLLAAALGRHAGVGVDCVAMCVNDILTLGARPLFFLDYLSMHRVDPSVVEEVVAGVVEGCRQAGCVLLGGETAASGDIIQPGGYDLSGTAVGVVERARLVRPRVRQGDVVLGLPSAGLHANGFSLVRRVLRDAGVDPRPHADELLRPTRIYVREVLAALGEGLPVHAMAHITGGGLGENLARCLPSDLDLRLDRGAWTPPPVFGWLERLGGVPHDEMWRVFNMGIGVCLLVPPEAVAQAVRLLPEARPIGEAVPGRGQVHLA
jgi:phosphoribosylformylglycinamidine cyclo-ligase